MKLGLSQLRTGLQKVIWDASSSEIKPMTETEKKKEKEGMQRKQLSLSWRCHKGKGLVLRWKGNVDSLWFLMRDFT